MSRVILVLVLLVACVAGLGFYLGWFRLDSDNDADGKSHITLTVDKEKIQAAPKKALEKVHGSPGTATVPATTTEKNTDEADPVTPLPQNPE